MNDVCAVMPAYNQAEFLNEAIDAVVGQVDTLVVVNDGSTDNTQEIIDSREDIDKLLLHPNSGSAAAPINWGVDWLRKNYSFEWLTWVSSDNVVYPDWIQTELEAAEAHDDGVGAVYSAMQVHYERDVRRKKADHVSWRPYSKHDLYTARAAYFGCSFIIRQECWPEHRGQLAHDYDHWARVEEQCWMRDWAIIGVPRPLAMYRVHPGQVGIMRPSGKDAKRWWKETRIRRDQMGLAP